jgi:polar amino acid transport system substrate-binding protein
MQASRQGIVKLEAAKSNEANLKKLAGHRIDCYASDRAAARYSARQLQPFFATEGFRLVEVAELSGEDTFIGYSGRNNPSYKADFIVQMDAALEAMKKSGEMARIVGDYLH